MIIDTLMFFSITMFGNLGNAVGQTVVCIKKSLMLSTKIGQNKNRLNQISNEENSEHFAKIVKKKYILFQYRHHGEVKQFGNMFFGNLHTVSY